MRLPTYSFKPGLALIRHEKGGPLRTYTAHRGRHVQKMKKILLGTTAWVGLGTIGPTPALAKFDITVAGEWYAAYGFVNQDDGTRNGVPESGHSRQNQAINQDYEVHILARETLDDGLVIGGHLELFGASNNSDSADNATSSTESGSAGSDQIDERWIYFRAGFGEIRIGDQDDARLQKSYTAPDPTDSLFGVNSPTFTFRDVAIGQAVSTNSTIADLEDHSAKILYFTPSFAGFQLAVSYAPDGTNSRSSFGTGGTNEADQVSNATAIGLNYSADFGEVTIEAGGGYTMAKNETNDGDNHGQGDPYIWAVGANIGYDELTVGGSISFGNNLTSTGFNGDAADRAHVFDIGATYELHAVTIGLDWSRGCYDDMDDGDVDQLDDVQLGLSYELGPGVNLAGFTGWFKYNDGGPDNNDNTGWQTGIGAALTF
jgi:outer membrane protein OmpU